MKNFFGKLNELEKMLFISSFVSIFIMLVMLIPFFVANQPGWLIGAAIGSVIEVVNIFLLYKGSETALTTFKTSIFLLFYFFRLTLFIVGFVVTAMLGFGFASIQPIPAFNYSIWGVLIAYTPSQLIVTIVMAKSKKSILTISENNKKEDK